MGAHTGTCSTDTGGEARAPSPAGVLPRCWHLKSMRLISPNLSRETLAARDAEGPPGITGQKEARQVFPAGSGRTPVVPHGGGWAGRPALGPERPQLVCPCCQVTAHRTVRETRPHRRRRACVHTGWALPTAVRLPGQVTALTELSLPRRATKATPEPQEVPV